MSGKKRVSGHTNVINSKDRVSRNSFSKKKKKVTPEEIETDLL